MLNGDSLIDSGLSLVTNSDFSSIYLAGTVNSTYAGQQKTLQISATNSAGLTATKDITINYLGLPTRNSEANLVLNENKGQSISVDLASYFNSIANSGSNTFANDNASSIQITGPDGTNTLTGSSLGKTGGLILTGSTLSGSILSAVTSDTYVIAIHAKNNVGYAVCNVPQ